MRLLQSAAPTAPSGRKPLARRRSARKEKSNDGKEYAMQALAGLSEPWSNAACMGYCLMAMRQAGVPEPMQRKVLACLKEKFDFYSLADAENAGYIKAKTGEECRFQTFSPD